MSKKHSEKADSIEAMHPESLMMSYGYRPEWSEGAIKCPIFQTSTFVFETAEAGKAFFEVAYGLREQRENEVPGLIYSRLNNPDLEILEDRLTLWDKAEEAAVFESGMAAITTTLFRLLRPGDYILHSEPVYGGTDYFINHVLPEFGVKSIGVKAGTPCEEVRKLLNAQDVQGKLRVIYVETPANPTNALADIEECSKMARDYSTNDKDVILVVDNTFLGPLWQHPLEHGADLVIYSATKYIGGHSDVIAGVCLGSKKLMSEIKMFRSILGATSGPWTGWLLLRSLETLKIRMTQQVENARHIADFLVDQPKVEKVFYLGHLEQGTRQYHIYKKQCLSPGAMISFNIKGGEAEAFKFLNNLELFHLAVSLGGTESLAEHPATMTHSDIPVEEQRRMGISDQMVRLSIGVENYEDLIADIKQALETV